MTEAGESKFWAEFLKLLPIVVFPLVVVVSLAASFFSPVAASQLTVIGSLLPTVDHSEVRGRVFRDGEAVQKASVWSIVDYANGQHDSPPATQTDDKGEFSIAPIPSAIGDGKNTITTATVYARLAIPAPAWYRSATTLRGLDIVRAPGSVSREIVQLSPYKLAPLPVIFLTSAMLPFFGKQMKWKYLLAIFMAFVFTGLMIGYISLGLRYVSTAGRSRDILALGFASVYQGSYVKDVPPEWMFSFTAPPPKPADRQSTESQPGSPTSATPATDAKPSAATGTTRNVSNSSIAESSTSPPPKAAVESSVLDRGFGAPLWVLLVSVVGAGILTVGLIVGEIKDMPDPDQPDKIRDHLQAIVQHQFYILFAPVGAIFVYQIMVVSSAASSNFTVALAALGAGAAMSALLTKAVSSATAVFGSGERTSSRSDATMQVQAKA